MDDPWTVLTGNVNVDDDDDDDKAVLNKEELVEYGTTSGPCLGNPWKHEEQVGKTNEEFIKVDMIVFFCASVFISKTQQIDC
mmetsp:Transcript_16234/g.39666  ORF Transcript_16234/g.39666 Transcript_16234/m.39666 type:complete len:82 (-) Transcript_16234:35-280(-)